MNRALLAWGAFAFLVTILGKDQAGATFFRTEGNLFSCLGELSVGEGPPRAEQWLWISSPKWRSGILGAQMLPAISLSGESPGVQCGVSGRKMETLFPKSKWRKPLVSLSVIAVPVTLNMPWRCALYPTVCFGSREERRETRQYLLQMEPCILEWDIDWTSWVSGQPDVSWN